MSMQSDVSVSRTYHGHFQQERCSGWGVLHAFHATEISAERLLLPSHAEMVKMTNGHTMCLHARSWPPC